MKRLFIDLGAAHAVAFVLAVQASSQNNQAASRTATVMGTVTDINGDAISNAMVVLKEVDRNDPRTIVTTENGMFEFHGVTPDISYQLSISAQNFADWTSPPIILSPDQFKIVTRIQLRIATERTTVDVHYDPVGMSRLLQSSSRAKKSTASSESFRISTFPMRRILHRSRRR